MKLKSKPTIAQKSTPKAHQYLVINWDFSAVDASGSAEEIRQRLHNHINGCIEHFLVRYQAFLKHEIQPHPTTVFKAVKSGTKLGIDRIFITGVSPVVMSDISSGFNIARNIYLNSKFNDLRGFWETEM